VSRVVIKTNKDILAMKKACEATAKILDEVGSIVAPGVTTQDIDDFVAKKTKELGGIAATLGYRGYPKSCCTSLNEVVCHGIPSKEVVLKRGDIINIDCTTILEGFHGDSSRMYFVGGKEECSKQAQHLVDFTKEALYVGISAVAPGNRTGDIGYAIQRFVEASGRNYGIVREYTGHGIGREFHENPQIMHFGKKGTGYELHPGMTFTIEPMLNAGTAYTVLSKEDGWTVTTKDGSLSAQWEHTVLVTRDGCEVLTHSDVF
jgi:methionyl aminopeptidase